MTERRRLRSIDFGLLFLIMMQIVIFAFGYGKLTQKVGDIQNQVNRIERILNHRGSAK